MAYYYALTFDNELFKSTVKSYLVLAMESAIKSVMDGVKYWSYGDGLTIKKYAADFDGVEYVIETANVKAFIQEFGSGEKMNVSSNPFFSSYKHGPFWNPERNGSEIVGRPEGEYETPDWESGFGTTVKYSSGTHAGKRIPWLKGESPDPVISECMEEIHRATIYNFNTNYHPVIQEMINTGKFITRQKVTV
ncbi:hypothetical protein [Eubacterium limosum]|uniref:hypothetical protein n=1 Tax=Eubacterium limosum TaxID=1736 RepID=UPI001062F38E|nr:hypothetical protein [Eubacterium limosum]